MNSKILRVQLLALLEGGNAHITTKQVLADFPLDYINTRANGIPYSLWELMEHMRIAQYDILDFIRNPNYKERKWPDEYWPSAGKKADETDWKSTIKNFEDDLETLKEMVKNPETDFTGPIPHIPDYTILREILLVADHNAYHTGQIIAIRRALNIY